MNIKAIVIMAGIITIITGYSFAADSTLTLKSVIDLAIKQSTSTQLSKNQVDQKKVSVLQEKDGFLPEASASLSSGSSGKLNSSDPWSSSTSGSLSASYTYTPSASANYNSAKAQASASEFTHKQTVNDVAADAILAYTKALYAQKTIAIVKNNLDYQKSKLSQIEEYRTAGKKSIADVLQQQTVVAEGEASLLEAEQTYGKALLTLFKTAGIDLNSRLLLDTTDLSFLVTALSSTDTAAAIFDSIPQIQAQQKAIESSAFSLKSARLAYAPSITGSASTGISYDGIIGEDHDVSDPTGRVSFSLSYPLFDQFQRKHTIQKQSLTLQSAKLQLTELERTVQLQFKQYMYDLEIARKQLSVAETRLTAAKQSLDATTQRYDAGASTLVEVALVNNSYLSAVNSQLSAESAIMTACVNLLQVNGQTYTFFEKLYSTR